MAAERRTLVVAPNWIGDAVMAQPLLAALAAADVDRRIDVLSPPHMAPVFRAMREVSRVHEFGQRHGKLDLLPRWKLARQLRSERYDEAVVLPNSAKSALIPWLAGIPVRAGHLGERRRVLLNRIVPAAAQVSGESGRKTRPPMVEHYAAIARMLDAGTDLAPAPDPLLQRDFAGERAVREALGLPADGALIVLCPGAEYGPAKRWPARHFAALARMLLQHRPKASVVLVGSARERSIATEIATLSGMPLHNACGETSLAQAMHLIAQADAVVSNDSGMMHVAAAYRRPQVAVFGSSDPRHTPPRSPLARIEWLHLSCSPCFQRKCPLGHTNCLNMLAPERVYRSLRVVLEAADVRAREAAATRDRDAEADAARTDCADDGRAP